MDTEYTECYWSFNRNTIEKGNIKEINSILAAMDKMREELRLSLERQWKAE